MLTVLLRISHLASAFSKAAPVASRCRWSACTAVIAMVFVPYLDPTIKEVQKQNTCYLPTAKKGKQGGNSAPET